MIRPGRAAMCAALVLAAGASSLSAQDHRDPLGRLLAGDDPASAILSADQLDILRRQLAININSLPAPTSADAQDDPYTKLMNYGPFNIERAVLVGHGTLHTFFALQGASWADLDSIDLDEGDLFQQSIPFLGRPAVQSRAALHLTTMTGSVGATYGLTPHLDLGAVIPLQTACVDGDRTVTTAGAVEQQPVSSCDSGIGDIVVRAKYSRSDRSGNPVLWALHAAVSLATGDVDRLLGKGTTQTTVSLLVSRYQNSWQPFGSFGATLGGQGVQFRTVDVFGLPGFIIDSVSAPPSLNFGGGTNFVLGMRMTASVEVLGRVLHHGALFRAVNVLSSDNLETTPVNWQPNVLGSIGAKYRAGNAMLVGGYLSTQMSRAGLRPSWIAGASVTVGKLPVTGDK
jgi:hypothetical protein